MIMVIGKMEKIETIIAVMTIMMLSYPSQFHERVIKLRN